MGTGSRGTFAIAWSDTEIDGLPGAPFEELTIGASWSWNGQAVRVDGPQDVLVLDEAHGAAELRDRAGLRTPRIVGMAAARGPNRDDGLLDPDGPLRDGFTVTDGRRQYPVAVLRNPATGRMLLAFPGAMPPPATELWVTAMTEAPRHEIKQDAKAVICFTQGTKLRTPDGDRRVEDLAPGDRVITRDDGAQEVYWVGSSVLTGARLHVSPELRPIRIRAAALGSDLPDGELLVSPQHRVLVRGRAARALFNTDEVLVAAADLINDHSITTVHSLKSLTYYHLALARHQVVWANGVPSESFHPGEAALSRLEGQQLERLLRMFPDVARDPARYGAPARRMLTRAEAAILRHDLPKELRGLSSGRPAGAGAH
ncbi:Hint domain-containing protein [Frigidibacter sp. ROC022]|uniref:Hint domain-containing protein n=1 Tax=Frigidibacter sp. ROC022 TaxID=2971796 RepID=UPI00215AD2B8|nr:Hint domain-containing protein [Frigidibacter sp. ROC022]MCR8722912.1 Hint domain-containing protein [Frigidibacter sp. ROC022]